MTEQQKLDASIAALEKRVAAKNVGSIYADSTGRRLMPILKNSKHERFAQLLVHGRDDDGRPMTVTDAHEKAGYRRNDGNASALSQRPDIQERVMEIKGSAGGY